MHFVGDTVCGKSGGAKRAMFAVVFGAILLAALLVPQLAMAATPRLGTSLPSIFSRGTIGSVASPSLGTMSSLKTFSAAGVTSSHEVAAMTLDSTSGSGEVQIPSMGNFFWVGDYLCIQGLVGNDQSSPVGMVRLAFTVKSADTTIATDTGWALIYNLVPDNIASYTDYMTLPVPTGTAVTVFVSAFGTIPTEYPTAVDLTLVGRTETVINGLRAYSCSFRNDSRVAVESPVAGGWELNSADDLIDTLFDYDDGLVINPGETWTSVVQSTFNDVPTTVDTYAQALPIPVTDLPIYRFFNRNNGSHFYTASAGERDTVIAQYSATFSYEGRAYGVNTTNPYNNAPLYRFYNKKNGSHFYTASLQERNTVIALWGATYNYEGPAYNVCTYSAGTTPVYRFYNRNNGSHFYTVSVDERNTVMAAYSATYSYEGVAFFVAL
ncbi:MAG: hypothetical protein HGA39_00300 [Coriobacteriia bacterium]|nr:hypothetical protein [Coriobacteriia bacterium]